MNPAKARRTSGTTIPQELSSLARALAAEPNGRAISRIVLTGSVRFAEFTNCIATAVATGAVLIYPRSGWSWGCAALILVLAAAAVLASQALGNYTVSALRNPIERLPRLALAWT